MASRVLLFQCPRADVCTLADSQTDNVKADKLIIGADADIL